MARTKAKAVDDDEEEKGEEAIRLKIIAEEKYKCSNLKSALKYAKRAQRLCPNLDGISEMLTSFKILSKSSSSSGPDWYAILEVEPFSHINSIKKQYKKLALILHPDKNTCIASEEAFKRVSEANQLLSDKFGRKDYDLKLRIALQSQATTTTTTTAVVESSVQTTFWTACGRCRLLHQFDRSYIGHFLICPSCKKRFLAEEFAVEGQGDDDDYYDGVKEKEDRVPTKCNLTMENQNQGVRRSLRVPKKRKFDIADDVSRSGSRSKKVEEIPEMTLAEMQLEAKRKLLQGTAKKTAEKMKVKEKEAENKNEKLRAREGKKQNKQMGKEKERGVVTNLENSDLEIMAVEDSDFHDFDKDRTGRCFKKAQIWAIYDDDDGMPRHYGLINEVESVNPFVVKLSWLDMETNGDERLICWEKSGLHISCGRFKVSRKIVVDSVNVFSHLVQCERVAREIYWIYPRKGSIWALYNERGLSGDEGNQLFTETRCYDIVVSLTSYSDMHGLSMAYLEKVEGFKTIFKRQEIGCHAIRWLEKDDFRLFSHQIPAKKLSGTEASRDLPSDCWELDPASLPPDMLSHGWER